MIKHPILLLAALFLLTGCSYGKYSFDKDTRAKADMRFIGIPALAGAVGTSFPIGDGYSLTARHVAKIMIMDVVAYHEVCDIALIRAGKGRVDFRPAVAGENVRMYGYSALSTLPVSSRGIASYQDHYDGCPAFASTSGVVQGMSGGPVYGDDDAVVGVVIAYNKRLGVSVFFPWQSIGTWVEEKRATHRTA
ncbi:S1 family peptidase [Sodalis sp. RH22]|uniref:S1 family peptidase n=1 Tax=unclassified Sodalis (in: enterobacteria) TaxID=2636512 RepID=UPI0039B5967A